MLVLLQFLAVVAMVTAIAGSRRRVGARQRLTRVQQAVERVRGMGQRAFLAANVGVIAVLLLAPLAVLVQRSLWTSHGYGFGYYRALFSYDATTSTLLVAPWETIENSVRYAALATVIALVVGGLVVAAMARAGGAARVWESVLVLPLGISAVTVGFGFLITLDDPPLDLRESSLLIPLAQALVAIPFVVRIVLPVLRAIDPRLREAAAVLGASPWRVWRDIDLPMVWRAGTSAAGFAFAISLGEFGATVFIARPDNPTIPVAIARLLSRPGEFNYGQAMALSVILMLLCTVVLLALERIRLPHMEVL